MRGDVSAMDSKWNKKAVNTQDYNTSRAVLQLTLDKDFKVWQLDMAVPGYTCSVAPFETDVKKALQSFQVVWQRLGAIREIDRVLLRSAFGRRLIAGGHLCYSEKDRS
jgi:hypothetical protein